MIIMILLVILFITGVIITIRHEYDGIDCLGTMMMLFSGAAIILCTIMIICTHVGVDYKINEDHMQYEGLCRRLEIISSDYEDVSKSEVIKDVTEWNTQVYHDQY
jgi:cytochrome b subunit of formate dehydrogenase